MMETFNAGMDFTVHKGSPIRYSHKKFGLVPLDGSVYTDMEMRVIKNVNERQDEWFPFHPDIYNQTTYFNIE